MWASAVDVVARGTTAARAASTRPGVDPGRRQQDLAERRHRLVAAPPPAPRPSRRRRASAGAAPGTAAPRSRSHCAISARTSEKPLAWSPDAARPRMTSPARDRACRRSRRRRSTTPMQQPARSNSSASIRPGCSAVSPPTSAQPASRQPAATPPTSSATPTGSSRPDRDVVEEGERLGAGAHDVVGAHRDEVDADRVEAPERRGDRRLGARRRRSTRRAAARGSRPGSRTRRRTRRARRPTSGPARRVDVARA